MSLLRRNPLSALHTDYIQMILELSKEQGFEVTYFNIGMTPLMLVFIQLMQQFMGQQSVKQAGQPDESLLHLEV